MEVIERVYKDESPEVIGIDKVAAQESYKLIRTNGQTLPYDSLNVFMRNINKYEGSIKAAISSNEPITLGPFGPHTRELYPYLSAVLLGFYKAMSNKDGYTVGDVKVRESISSDSGLMYDYSFPPYSGRTTDISFNLIPLSSSPPQKELQGLSANEKLLSQFYLRNYFDYKNYIFRKYNWNHMSLDRIKEFEGTLIDAGFGHSGKDEYQRNRLLASASPSDIYRFMAEKHIYDCINHNLTKLGYFPVFSESYDSMGDREKPIRYAHDWVNLACKVALTRSLAFEKGYNPMVNTSTKRHARAIELSISSPNKISASNEKLNLFKVPQVIVDLAEKSRIKRLEKQEFLSFEKLMLNGKPTNTIRIDGLSHSPASYFPRPHCDRSKETANTILFMAFAVGAIWILGQIAQAMNK